MANNDFNPDLTKLDQTYQVLTELHGEGDSRTYLARHLRLNRDVTISVFRASNGDHRKALTQFASDVSLLTEARNPHIVPVIEGAWLDDTAFATVRARVRGATLDQLLATGGPMPITRVAAAVHDISDAIIWARDAGLAQRDVAPWDIVFQQGSGRVLLSFEPGQTALSTMRTPCDDAQAVRRLVIEMLSGEVNRSQSSQDIAVPRSIPSDVADALAAVRHCSARNATSSLNALLNALDAAATRPPREENTQTAAVTGSVVVTPTPGQDQRPSPERVVPTVVQRSADISSGSVPVITSVPPHRRSAQSEPNGTVVVRKPSFGFNARLGTAIVVLAIVGAAGALFLNRNSSSPPTVAVAASPDSGTSAAGEVALHPTSPAPVGTTPVTRAPRVVLTTTDSSRTTDSAASATRRKLTPPPRVTARPADSGSIISTKPLPRDSSPARKKPVVLDSAAEAERQFQRDSAADVADPCLSASATDQHRCLMAAIEKNDHDLNAVYARLIAGLRRQSGAASADPDPEAVNELREAQRNWVDERDAACRDVGEEPLYAKSRAACFAQKSADRVRELRRRIEAIPPTQ